MSPSKQLVIKIIKIIITVASKLSCCTKEDIIIFRYDEIGDWLLWLNAASTIREHYPKEKYRIILFCKPANLELSRSCPFWDEVIPFCITSYKSRLLYRLKLIWKLLKVDIIINPVLNRTITVDQLIGYSGAKERIGVDVSTDQIFYRTESERSYGNSFYTKLYSLDLKQHMLDINADFALGISGKECNHSPNSLEFLKIVHPEFRNYILIVPGAGSPKRCWQPDKFSEIMNRILSIQPESKVVMSGTFDDIERSTTISRSIDYDEKIINLCGKTNLLELCGLISNASLIITNESGALHLAACYKTPSVCILGGGHFNLFHPYPKELSETINSKAVYSKMPCFNCNWHCFQNPYIIEPYPCISRISVESVWQEVESILI